MEWWNQTAARILDNLTYEGGLGPVLNTEKKTNLKELLKEDVIIELDTLSNDDKKFLTEALRSWNISKIKKLALGYLVMIGGPI